MTSLNAKAQQVATGSRPALVVVDDNDETRITVVSALRRRFEPDYEVVETMGSEGALAELDRMHRAGADIALIIANQYMSEEPGTEVLAKTRDPFPTARRLVLIDFADSWVMPSIAQASTLGQVDHCEYRPWGDRDERFLAAVGDILAEWSQENARGDARLTIIGESGEPTFELLGEVLQRWQTYPIAMLEAGTPDADRFLSDRGIQGELPIVALAEGRVVTGASIAKISDMVGQGVDTASTVYDVAVVGLGPAGYSSAVNAASEGMRVILIEPSFSQASSSPMIRNYLGFPAGVSGAELMRRAWTQTLLFGAVGRIGRRATEIRRENDYNAVVLDDGSQVSAHVVMLATGVEYRRIGVPSVDRLIGRGVFYGYGAADAKAMSGLDVAVVGGANSAVQGAVHLARYARSVHLIVRGGSLADSASDYLIDHINALREVTVHLNSEVAEGQGRQHLRGVTVRNRVSDKTTALPVAGLFVMIGAVPRTDWLPAELARDSKGFILTGDDGPRPERPEDFRLPYQTTFPGVFAVGDVRSGSVKRVAAAVGEGSAAIQHVLRYHARTAGSSEAGRERAVGEPIPAGTTR